MSSVTYIALLRGINVTGHRIVKMEALRKSCAALGWEQVRTYVQSGNVLFQARKQDADGLAQSLQGKILRDFGYDVAVVMRTAEEIRAALHNNPFLKRKGVDTSRLYVTFLPRVPEKAAVKALEKLRAEPDEFQCSGKEIHLYLPNGAGRTKLSINVFEKLLSVRATMRNWNTVNKLHEMSARQS